MLVRGTVEGGGAEVGVVVNGVVAQVVGTAWIVPDLLVTPGETNALTAVATNPWGGTATATALITVPADAGLPPVVLRPSPASGMAPLTVTFAYDFGLAKVVSSVRLDFGDGAAPFTGTTLVGVTHTYAAPGNYPATVTVTDMDGATFAATTVISVMPTPDFAGKWDGLKAALARGDVEGALLVLGNGVRDRYRAAVQALGENLAAVAAGLGDLRLVAVGSDVAEAVTVRLEDGVRRVYFIYFAPDTDGVWRIVGM